MKRGCLSILKLGRSQTYLAFPFLSSRVAQQGEVALIVILPVDLRDLRI